MVSIKILSLTVTPPEGKANTFINSSFRVALAIVTGESLSTSCLLDGVHVLGSPERNTATYDQTETVDVNGSTLLTHDLPYNPTSGNQLRVIFESDTAVLDDQSVTFFTIAEEEERQKNNMLLVAGVGVLGLGVLYLATRKSSRRKK